MMMNIRTILASAALVLAAGSAAASEAPGSYARQLQERDSLLIGDQVRYGFRTEVEQGSSISLLPMQLPEGVEAVGGASLDTLGTRRGRTDIDGHVTLTSFQEGTYALPPFEVEVIRPDGSRDTLRFAPDTLRVCTIPVDTATFELHGIKGQAGYPLTFREVLPWAGGALLLAGLVFLAVWLVRRKGRPARSEAREPAHITALRKLDVYRSSKYWEPSRQKLFYTGVTDAVREYISSRYGIPAMEMTTAEIFSALAPNMEDKALCEDLRSLFERADYVKFAKYVASEQENSSAVPVAVRFVNDTYQHDIEEQSRQKEE